MRLLSRNLDESVKLANLVAGESHQLYREFLAADRQRLNTFLLAVRDSALDLLDRDRNAFYGGP